MRNSHFTIRDIITPYLLSWNCSPKRRVFSQFCLSWYHAPYKIIWYSLRFVYRWHHGDYHHPSWIRVPSSKFDTVNRNPRLMPCYMAQSHQMNVTPLHHQIYKQSYLPQPKLIVSLACLKRQKYHHILIRPIRHQNNMDWFLNSTDIIHIMKKTTILSLILICVHMYEVRKWRKWFLEDPNWYTWLNTVSRANEHWIYCTKFIGCYL